MKKSISCSYCYGRNQCPGCLKQETFWRWYDARDRPTFTYTPGWYNGRVGLL